LPLPGIEPWFLSDSACTLVSIPTIAVDMCLKQPNMLYDVMLGISCWIRWSDVLWTLLESSSAAYTRCSWKVRTNFAHEFYIPKQEKYPHQHVSRNT
jgi:hypothetical protein